MPHPIPYRRHRSGQPPAEADDQRKEKPGTAHSRHHPEENERPHRALPVQRGSSPNTIHTTPHHALPASKQGKPPASRQNQKKKRPGTTHSCHHPRRKRATVPGLTRATWLITQRAMSHPIVHRGYRSSPCSACERRGEPALRIAARSPCERSVPAPLTDVTHNPEEFIFRYRAGSSESPAAETGTHPPEEALCLDDPFDKRVEAPSLFIVVHYSLHKRCMALLTPPSSYRQSLRIFSSANTCRTHFPRFSSIFALQRPTLLCESTTQSGIRTWSRRKTDGMILDRAVWFADSEEKEIP